MSVSPQPLWFGFWGNNITETATFTNLQISGSPEVLAQGATVGVKGMLSIYDVLFVQGSSGLELRADMVRCSMSSSLLASARPFSLTKYKRSQTQRLAEESATVHRLLGNHTILGVFLGDELVWNCLKPSDLVVASNAVRQAFPRSTVGGSLELTLGAL